MIPSPSDIVTRRDPWHIAWRVVTGDRLLAASATGLAILLALAALLPQSPPPGSVAYARWQFDTQLRFGGAYGLLSGLGLFDMVHAIVFRVVAGLLGLSLATRLVDRLHDFRAASRSALPPDPAARSLEVSSPAGEVTRRLRGYRTRRSTADGITLADRFPWAHAGAIAAHIGPLVMLISLALSPLTDWRVDGLNAIPGNPQPVPDTSYEVQVSDVDASGQVSLTLLQAGRPIAQGVAAPGRPLDAGGVSLFVRDLLPALHVSGRGADGLPLKLKTRSEDEPVDELLLTFDADRPDAFFVVAPDAPLAVRVSLAGQSGDRAYHVSVIGGADARQVADAVLRPGQRVDANGSYFEFGDASHAVVAIVHAPSQAAVVAGGIVAIAGLACVALYPARRIWIVAVENGARVMCDDVEFDLDRLTAASRPE